MRCDEVRENLVAYLDGEISAEERERIESHLGGCPACRAERAALASTGDLLALISRRERSGLDLAGTVIDRAREEDAWCRHIRKELVAYLDGELSETEARPVREHLAECPDCEAERRALEETAALLARWTIPPLGVDLAAGLPGGRKRRGGRLVRVLAVAAAACVLALATLLLTRGTPKPQAAPPEDLLVNLDILESPELDRPKAEIEEMVESLDLLESISDDELALLGGPGGK